MLSSVLALYTGDHALPLPTQEEVFLCTSKTTAEEVELHVYHSTCTCTSIHVCTKILYVDNSAGLIAIIIVCLLTHPGQFAMATGYR